MNENFTYKMKLTDDEVAILHGSKGETLAKVMKTLVLYGDAFGAEKFVSVAGNKGHLVTSFGISVLKPVFNITQELIDAGLTVDETFSVDPRPLDKNVPSNFLLDFIFNNFMYSKQDFYEGQLKKLGLITINHEEFAQLHDVKVLLRAHGEPPATYELARKNHIEIIDATCPVVLRLQKRIKQEYATHTNEEKQIVIYGKNGHAEVLGLVGQTDGKAIVIEKTEEAKELNLNGYETLVQTKDDGEEVKLLAKMNEESISDLIILITGKDDCGLTLMKGKIKKENINGMIGNDKIMINGRE